MNTAVVTPPAAPAHSLAPFVLLTTPVAHYLRDSRWLRIAVIPLETRAGTMPEQRANALLFRASPALLQAAKAALPLLPRELNRILACNCRIDADYRPMVDTLPPDAQPHVRELVSAIELLLAAILLAEGD